MALKRVPLSLIRILLICLIALNLFLIFSFSAQNAEQSTETSTQVSASVAGTVIKDFESRPEAEQQETIQQIDPWVRSFAHAAEFGTLGGLIFFLLMTWKGKRLLQYGISCGAALITAIIDELLQSFSVGRATQISDMLVDFLGAIFVCWIFPVIYRLSDKCKSPATRRAFITLNRLPGTAFFQNDDLHRFDNLKCRKSFLAF